MICRATEFLFDEIIPIACQSLLLPLIVWVAYRDGLITWRKK